ncbi:MAG: hypothetical protein NVV72_10010 [Asticcacaulis sp.]|nr:hypothetical protein [Asticcacaulis sp.]
MTPELIFINYLTAKTLQRLLLLAISIKPCAAPGLVGSFAGLRRLDIRQIWH